MIKLTEQNAIEKILNKCKEKNYEFLGFVNDKWIGSQTHLKLKCNICNNVWESTSYSNFIHKNNSCPECKRKTLSFNNLLNDKDVISKIKLKCQEKNYEFIGFNNKENKYLGHKTKLILKCNICGFLWDSARYDHFLNNTANCLKCQKNKIRNTLKKTLEEQLIIAKQIHGNKYDYSLITDYENQTIKYPIICPIHGIFYLNFDKHIHRKQGCPKCHESKLERDVEQILLLNGITFFYQHKINTQRLDFYLPNKNIAIECQGIQHFKPIEVFGGDEGYNKTIELDVKKYKNCQQQNITLIYYTNQTFLNEIPQNSPIYKNNVFTDLSEIIDFIQKH